MKKERNLFISYGLMILAIASIINLHTLVAVISFILAFILLLINHLTYKFNAIITCLLFLLLQVLVIVILPLDEPTHLFIIAGYNSLLLYNLLVNNYETSKMFNCIVTSMLLFSLCFLALCNSLLGFIFQQTSNTIIQYIPLLVMLLVPFILYDLFLLSYTTKTKKFNHKIKLSDSF